MRLLLWFPTAGLAAAFTVVPFGFTADVTVAVAGVVILVVVSSTCAAAAFDVSCCIAFIVVVWSLCRCTCCGGTGGRFGSFDLLRLCV